MTVYIQLNASVCVLLHALSCDLRSTRMSQTGSVKVVPFCRGVVRAACTMRGLISKNGQASPRQLGLRTAGGITLNVNIMSGAVLEGQTFKWCSVASS